jgi:hypothetical protein
VFRAKKWNPTKPQSVTRAIRPIGRRHILEQMLERAVQRLRGDTWHCSSQPTAATRMTIHATVTGMSALPSHTESTAERRTQPGDRPQQDCEEPDDVRSEGMVNHVADGRN